MSAWFYFVILTAAVCIAVYLLYYMGFGVAKRIAAVIFVFRPGKNADRAVLDSCTGWVKHVGRFRESGIYEFILDARLAKGNAEVALLDRNKQQLLKLNQQSPAGKIELYVKSRYYLRWDFKSATGRCELHWEESA